MTASIPALLRTPSGRMVKQSVTDENFEQLPAGKSLSVDIGLRQAYDVQSPGEYEITYKAFNQRKDRSGLDTLTSNTVRIEKH